MKRVLVSIAAGVSIFVIGFLFLLLAQSLLDNPAGLASFVTWILVWPHLLLAKIGMPYPGRIISLAIGPIANIAILSVISYITLSLTTRKSPTTTTPPPPPLRFD